MISYMQPKVLSTTVTFAIEYGKPVYFLPAGVSNDSIKRPRYGNNRLQQDNKIRKESVMTISDPFDAVIRAVETKNLQMIYDAVVEQKRLVDRRLKDAVRAMDTDQTRYLLSIGANPNACDDDDCLLPQIAASVGHIQALHALAEAGCVGFDALDFNGSSALTSAAANGHIECVDYLLAHGHTLALDKHNPSYFNPIVAAVRNGHVGCLQSLLHFCEEREEFAFRIDDRLCEDAVSSKQIACLEILVDNGLNINAFNDSGLTPLCIAASEGNTDCIKFLVERGALIHLDGENAFSCCHEAARKGNVVALEMLFNLGAERDVTDRAGLNILHSAAEYDQSNVITWLLENSWNVMGETSNGTTAAHFAASQGNVDALDVLLRAGANITALTKKGTSVREFAIHHNQDEIVSLIDAYIAKKVMSEIVLSAGVAAAFPS